MEDLKNVRRVLRGDKNQCPGCGEFFYSTFAFEKHRTGAHGKDRRCLNREEMQEKGMVLREDGFWRSAANPMFAENESGPSV